MSDDNTKREVIFRQAIPSQVELAAQSALAPTVKVQSPFGRINFDGMTPAEIELCVRIAARGADFMKHYGVVEDQMGAACDIAVVHNNDGKLDLLKFLQADVTDFAHDYARIRRCLNRQTGRLEPGQLLLCKLAT